jgi:hypothetical protein
MSHFFIFSSFTRNQVKENFNYSPRTKFLKRENDYSLWIAIAQ